MYLSIGNDMAVREHSVIGIFDLDDKPSPKMFHVKHFGFFFSAPCRGG